MTEEQQKQLEAERQAKACREVQAAAEALIGLAESLDCVVTIETVPMRPLAMRNYIMAANVRPAR